MAEAVVLSVALKLDKIEYRAVIKPFVNKDLTPNGIHSKFIKILWGLFSFVFNN
jgi:hypothetical protein